MWMQDGCKVHNDSKMALSGSWFKVTWTDLKKLSLGGRPNTKPGDHGNPNAHNRWLILFYHVCGPAWIEIDWNSILVEGLITYGFTLHSRIRDHITWFWRCVGTTFGHFLWALTISWSRLLACVWSDPNHASRSSKLYCLELFPIVYECMGLRSDNF
jgi:hypothetical protein